MRRSLTQLVVRFNRDAERSNTWDALQFRSTTDPKLNAFWPQNYITDDAQGTLTFDQMVSQRGASAARASAIRVGLLPSRG